MGQFYFRVHPASTKKGCRVTLKAPRSYGSTIHRSCYFNDAVKTAKSWAGLDVRIGPNDE